MENIFRCGYQEIFIDKVYVIGNGFICFEWVQSQNNRSELFTSICHINKIDLQKSYSKTFGNVFEANGVKINMSAYNQILNLLSEK